jgi:hypothetical protein
MDAVPVEDAHYAGFREMPQMILKSGAGTVTETFFCPRQGREVFIRKKLNRGGAETRRKRQNQQNVQCAMCNVQFPASSAPTTLPIEHCPSDIRAFCSFCPFLIFQVSCPL